VCGKQIIFFLPGGKSLYNESKKLKDLSYQLSRIINASHILWLTQHFNRSVVGFFFETLFVINITI